VQVQLGGGQLDAATIAVGQGQAVGAQRVQHAGAADEVHFGAGCLQVATQPAADVAGTQDQDAAVGVWAGQFFSGGPVRAGGHGGAPEGRSRWVARAGVEHKCQGPGCQGADGVWVHGLQAIVSATAAGF
jgi:hypothetical protein